MEGSGSVKIMMDPDRPKTYGTTTLDELMLDVTDLKHRNARNTWVAVAP